MQLKLHNKFTFNGDSRTFYNNMLNTASEAIFNGNSMTDYICIGKGTTALAQTAKAMSVSTMLGVYKTQRVSYNSDVSKGVLYVTVTATVPAVTSFDNNYITEISFCSEGGTTAYNHCLLVKSDGTTGGIIKEKNKEVVITATLFLTYVEPKGAMLTAGENPLIQHYLGIQSIKNATMDVVKSDCAVMTNNVSRNTVNILQQYTLTSGDVANSLKRFATQTLPANTPFTELVMRVNQVPFIRLAADTMTSITLTATASQPVQEFEGRAFGGCVSVLQGTTVVDSKPKYLKYGSAVSEIEKNITDYVYNKTAVASIHKPSSAAISRMAIKTDDGVDFYEVTEGGRKKIYYDYDHAKFSGVKEMYFAGDTLFVTYKGAPYFEAYAAGAPPLLKPVTLQNAITAVAEVTLNDANQLFCIAKKGNKSEISVRQYYDGVLLATILQPKEGNYRLIAKNTRGNVAYVDMDTKTLYVCADNMLTPLEFTDKQVIDRILASKQTAISQTHIIAVDKSSKDIELFEYANNKNLDKTVVAYDGYQKMYISGDGDYFFKVYQQQSKLFVNIGLANRVEEVVMPRMFTERADAVHFHRNFITVISGDQPSNHTCHINRDRMIVKNLASGQLNYNITVSDMIETRNFYYRVNSITSFPYKTKT